MFLVLMLALRINSLDLALKAESLFTTLQLSNRLIVNREHSDISTDAGLGSALSSVSTVYL